MTHFITLTFIKLLKLSLLLAIDFIYVQGIMCNESMI